MVAMIVQSIRGPHRSHSLNSDFFSWGQSTAANFVPTADRSLLIVSLIGSSRVLNSLPPGQHISELEYCLFTLPWPSLCPAVPEVVMLPASTGSLSLSPNVLLSVYRSSLASLLLVSMMLMEVSEDDDDLGYSCVDTQYWYSAVVYSWWCVLIGHVTVHLYTTHRHCTNWTTASHSRYQNLKHKYRLKILYCKELMLRISV